MGKSKNIYDINFCISNLDFYFFMNIMKTQDSKMFPNLFFLNTTAYY